MNNQRSQGRNETDDHTREILRGSEFPVEVVGSGSLYLKLNVSYTHTDELVCVPNHSTGTLLSKSVGSECSRSIKTEEPPISNEN